MSSNTLLLIARFCKCHGFLFNIYIAVKIIGFSIRKYPNTRSFFITRVL